MLDLHIAANTRRIALHRASLTQLGTLLPNATEDDRKRLQGKIAELEAVNGYLARCR
jgi:hypothetical protein